MEKIITFLMLIIGVIHLLPLSGVMSSSQLESLYGIKIQDNNLEILMRHRAVLFGILGSFFVYAAFKPTIQPIAFIAAFLSIASFLWLSVSVGNFNAPIYKVVIADIVAAICLVVAVIIYYLKASA
ncbi:phosphopantetheine adenylyltransferase [Candidatus Uabimicrobium sp. HlEnr_7]|uniref:phosphopantetheine adenylyltransferase n=1 Tax=Candidatus Uabimicrobium helgolandensis TaxID=3095367 RepID=UPI003557F510